MCRAELPLTFEGALIFIRVLRMSNEHVGVGVCCAKALMLAHYCIMHELTIQMSPTTKPL